MKFQTYEPQWLDILRRQEEILRVESMSADDCFRLGSIMIRLAKEQYQRAASVRVITNGQNTFTFFMEGTDSNNEWWMNKKLNTCRLSGISSIRTLVEVAEGIRPMEPEYEIVNNFALCGGCFPLKNGEGRLLGYALCSGMPHHWDHQLIADALAEYLGREIPRLPL